MQTLTRATHTGLDNALAKRLPTIALHALQVSARYMITEVTGFVLIRLNQI